MLKTKNRFNIFFCELSSDDYPKDGDTTTVTGILEKYKEANK